MAERASFAAVALAGVALVATPAQAREEPLWEAGLGVAAIHFPDYRGSNESRTYGFPSPYFVYRGDFLKADRNGIRGILFNNDRLDLNLSVGASLPVRSSENRAREGMPDLKPSIELGPSLEVNLWRTPDRRAKVDLRFPVRGAISIESDPRYVGTQFFPHVNLDLHDPLGQAGWNLGMLVGPVFTDKRYNRYFYEVRPEFATATRAAYSPGGGFAGTEFIVGLSKRFPKFWVGAFARYDTLRGARFEDSPLVTSKKYVAGGIGFSWILGQSAQKVRVNEYGDDAR